MCFQMTALYVSQISSENVSRSWSHYSTSTLVKIRHFNLYYRNALSNNSRLIYSLRLFYFIRLTPETTLPNFFTFWTHIFYFFAVKLGRFTNTGSPHYKRSFYLRFYIYAIQKWPFFWNLSSNLQSSFVFFYANSLYASQLLESLSLTYNKVHLYLIYPYVSNTQAY